MDYLELALILVVPVKLLTDIVKKLTNNIPQLSGINPYAYSVFVGALLGFFFLPAGIDVYEKILTGIIAGAFPAPVLHDVLEIIREFKCKLREK
ncbi:MAG: hypothetical protein DDT42_01506 [candidate division WS2 bacterium]|uniref:Holin n=1 Tax=Psychracetigena formicireducens TaxID=2986056 RepID=A0A9E2F2F9_PSYF1|nr:hypothetical protein [Candidatus Psychracetigena formicireducens]MBT9145632.1 hypothetical protein [Candidatus Psychracetigena formicireducens]